MEPIVFLPILIAVFLPLFVLFLQRRHQLRVARRLQRQRRRERQNPDTRKEEEVSPMSNELIRSLIGKTCQITTGSLGEAFDKVTVLDVQENWMQVERKNKVRLINADYITSVKILDEGEA
ncbi:MAG: hypothetical protein GVY14_15645 [Spirochaetes bacterium]|jgi:hypothetical protein|nr:hypothetical protein [Spirochaetota bacterium]